MRAIILSAGFGNRMKPLTFKTHKTLLSIGNETVIEKIIKSLLACGINDVLIVTGYKANSIQEYLYSRFTDTKIQYVQNSQYETTNNIYSLWLAFQHIAINSDVILIESDLVYDPSLIEKLLNSPYPNVALVDKFRRGMDGTVVSLSGDIITNVIPPHLQTQNFDFSDKYKTLNIYKFSGDFVDKIFRNLLDYYIKIFDKKSYYELVLGILIYAQQETIHAEIVENGGLWAELDDPNDLSAAEYQFCLSKRYNILKDSFGGYWNYSFLDFSFIRNFYFPTDSMIAELRENVAILVGSYCSTQKILNQKLANFLWCSPEKVHLLNGASQIYPILVEYFSGKKLLIPQPAFGEYKSRFPESDVYLDKPGYYLADAEKRIAGVDAVIIVNPNNPTGSCCMTEEIYRLAAKHPEKKFLIDESFIDFSTERSIMAFLDKDPLANVILIKSFGKSLGVPGLRLGFVYSSDISFLNFLSARIPVWNSNSLAEFFLELLLKHRPDLQKSFEQTRQDRLSLQRRLSLIPYIEKVFPSQGNFILLRLKNSELSCNFCQNMLEKRAIFIKDVSTKFSDNNVYVRIAVRKPADNKILIEAMNDFAQ